MVPSGRAPAVLGALLLVPCLLATVPAAAQEPPPAPTDWVEDRADLLPPDRQATLSARLERLERETGARVVIATYPALPPDAALEDYTLRAVESWVVWREGEPTVALFVFRDDRRMRLEVGYGAEAVLTDLESRRILDGAVAPEFRRGDFAAGLEAAVTAIGEALRGEYAPATAEPATRSARGSGRGLSIGALLVVMLFWFFLVPLVLSRAVRPGSPLAGCSGCLALSGPVVFGPGRRGGWTTSSRGGFGGFGGGGGFSGGGGSFGGGGASGSW